MSFCGAGQPVLRAMGISPDVGMGAVRFSLGRGTAKAEIGTVAATIRQTVGVAGC